MAAPVIYRSSDAGAPVLMGVGGSLIDVLQACLVDGYGGSFATGTITGDGTNVAAGDTVTIGSITYTFRSSVASQNDVLIGASAIASIQNLFWTINLMGTAGTTYVLSQALHPDVWASFTNPVITLNARKGGTSGNAITLARASAGTPHYTVSGANLSGGSGSVTKSGAGWTRSFSGSSGQAVFRPSAGVRFYLQVDDTGPGSGGGREARCFGFEVATAWNTGTGQFPTVAQVTAGSVLRKSVTLDATARAWTLLVDDRTLYLFTYSGDAAGLAHGFSFGDFYSLISGDAYKCLIMGGTTESASAVTTTHFFSLLQATLGTAMNGHWLPRNYAGAGGSTVFVKPGDIGIQNNNASTSTQNLIGSIGFPNPADGGLYVAPLRVIDGSTPGATITGTIDLRGKVRGLYHVPHAVTSFADGDTFSGIGDYTGRTFMIVKGANGGFVAVETTAWDTSA